MFVYALGREFKVLLASCTLGFSLLGCSPGVEVPAGMPELYPVALTLTQSGSPLEGASVQLLAQDPAIATWQCGGYSDATGKVEIKTMGQHVGAPVGKYKVLVTKELIETSAGADASPGAASSSTTYALVDPKFQSAETTPATIDVTAGENAPAAIDLGAPVKIAAPKL
jgi:hypothetical protein